MTGEFINAQVGNQHFSVDEFFSQTKLDKIQILHSDIQGAEMEMLGGAEQSLSEKKIDYIFISTHSQLLHCEVMEKLRSKDYLIEVSSDFDTETTSFDGFIMASNKKADRIFVSLHILEREQIVRSKAIDFVKYLNSVVEEMK